jgi:TP901 family phage tail tape measure protein
MGEVRLDILVGAKDQGASATLQSISQNLDQVSTKAALAGGAITAMLTKSALAGAQLGDEIAKASKRTGIAVEELSKLRYAAGQQDVAFAELTNGLRFLARNMDNASKGMKESKEAFDALGISVTDADGELRPVGEVLLEVADGMKRTTNQTERTALAMAVFGRSGAQMLPFIQEGSGSIEELTERAEKLGLVMSEETAAAAEEFGDRWSDMKEQLLQFSVVVTEELLPVLRDIEEPMTAALDAFREFNEAHPGLIENVAKLGAALLVVAGAAKGIVAIKGIGATFAGMGIAGGAGRAAAGGSMVPAVAALGASGGTAGRAAAGGSMVPAVAALGASGGTAAASSGLASTAAMGASMSQAVNKTPQRMYQEAYWNTRFGGPAYSGTVPGATGGTVNGRPWRSATQGNFPTFRRAGQGLRNVGSASAGAMGGAGVAAGTFLAVDAIMDAASGASTGYGETTKAIQSGQMTGIDAMRGSMGAKEYFGALVRGRWGEVYGRMGTAAAGAKDLLFGSEVTPELAAVAPGEAGPGGMPMETAITLKIVAPDGWTAEEIARDPAARAEVRQVLIETANGA